MDVLRNTEKSTSKLALFAQLANNRAKRSGHHPDCEHPRGWGAAPGEWTRNLAAASTYTCTDALEAWASVTFLDSEKGKWQIVPDIYIRWGAVGDCEGFFWEQGTHKAQHVYLGGSAAEALTKLVHLPKYVRRAYTCTGTPNACTFPSICAVDSPCDYEGKWLEPINSPPDEHSRKVVTYAELRQEDSIVSDVYAAQRRPYVGPLTHDVPREFAGFHG